MTDIDKKILSIDFDDDNENYEAFYEYLENDAERKKNNIASEIDKFGEEFLAEIESKKYRQKIKRDEYIKYILKHEKHIYSKDELESYSYEDVFDIYQKVKNKKTSFFVKLFNFIFNFE